MLRLLGMGHGGPPLAPAPAKEILPPKQPYTLTPCILFSFSLTRGSSSPVALNLCLGYWLLSLDKLDPRKDVWVGLADNFFHSGMPPFNIVGSGLVLIEVVPMEWWKVSIDPGGREVVNQLINFSDVGGVLLDGKPSCSNICQWTECHWSHQLCECLQLSIRIEICSG